MNTINIITPELLAKYILGNVSEEERAMVAKQLEASAELRSKFERLIDIDSWWDGFWRQHDKKIEKN